MPYLNYSEVEKKMSTFFNLYTRQHKRSSSILGIPSYLFFVVFFYYAFLLQIDKVSCFDFAESCFYNAKEHLALNVNSHINENARKKDISYYNIFSGIINKSKNFRWQKIPVDSVEGFYIRPYNRFGNNVYQLTRVLQYCKFFNYKRLVIHRNFLFFKEDFMAGDIHVEIRTRQTNISRLIRGFYYFPVPGMRLNFSYINLFKDEFLKNFPNTTLGENELYIHLRGADIYISRSHPNYGQPPLNYYFDVMKFGNWTSIYVLSEDKVSPMVSSLLERRCIFKDTNITDCISIMVNCYNLVIGKTTFAIALSFLSRNLRQLFTFNFPTNKLRPHYNCDPDTSYIQVILNKWYHTPEQLALMFHSKCSSWKFYEMKNEDAPNTSELFHKDNVYYYWFN